MGKYFLLLAVSLSCNATQTKQEIIDYCKNTYLEIGGNTSVLWCIEEELKAQKKIDQLSIS